MRRGERGKGPRGPRKQREERPTKSACNPRVPKAQNKLLRASCLACAIFGAGTMIPGAESCGSVGKLGDPKARRLLLMEMFEKRGDEKDATGGTQVDREERTREKRKRRGVGIRDSPSGREDRGRFPKRGGRRG